MFKQYSWSSQGEIFNLKPVQLGCEHLCAELLFCKLVSYCYIVTPFIMMKEQDLFYNFFEKVEVNIHKSFLLMNIIDVKRIAICCLCSSNCVTNSIETYLRSSIKTLNERLYLQIKISFFLHHIVYESFTLSI